MNEYSAGRVDDPGSWAVPELLIRFIRATYELNRCEPRHEIGLSAQQIRALLYLVHHDGYTIKDLAQALCISEARASRLAEELAEAGHIVHQRNAADRRQVRLHVTPEASEKARRIYRQRTGAIDAALAGATQAEIDTFTRVLERIVEEFEALAQRSVDIEPAILGGHVDLAQKPVPPVQA
jgi:DNA-binding MarR family transcriptional regulator